MTVRFPWSKPAKPLSDCVSAAAKAVFDNTGYTLMRHNGCWAAGHDGRVLCQTDALCDQPPPEDMVARVRKAMDDAFERAERVDREARESDWARWKEEDAAWKRSQEQQREAERIARDLHEAARAAEQAKREAESRAAAECARIERAERELQRAELERAEAERRTDFNRAYLRRCMFSEIRNAALAERARRNRKAFWAGVYVSEGRLYRRRPKSRPIDMCGPRDVWISGTPESFWAELQAERDVQHSA